MLEIFDVGYVWLHGVLSVEDTVASAGSPQAGAARAIRSKPHCGYFDAPRNIGRRIAARALSNPREGGEGGRVSFMQQGASPLHERYGGTSTNRRERVEGKRLAQAAKHIEWMAREPAPRHAAIRPRSGFVLRFLVEVGQWRRSVVTIKPSAPA